MTNPVPRSPRLCPRYDGRTPNHDSHEVAMDSVPQSLLGEFVDPADDSPDQTVVDV